MEYALVDGDDLDEFNSQVNFMLSEGWDIVGPAVVIPGPKYHQTLERRKNPTATTSPYFVSGGASVSYGYRHIEWNK